MNPKLTKTGTLKLDGCLTGNFVYCKGEDFNEKAYKDGHASFFCGPEEELSPGKYCLSDNMTCDESLKVILNGFNVSIGQAENWHGINYTPGTKLKDVWALIEKLLILSGAIKMR